MTKKHLLPKNCDVIFTQEQIKQSIKKLSQQLNDDYKDKEVIFITIMNGGMIFASDLAKQLTFELEMDYVQISRYGIETHGGQLIWKSQPDINFEGKHVLLVDDIFDEGYTLKAVDEWCLHEKEAASVKSVVLVSKVHNRGYADYRPDYFGLEVEDLYIFGYGMDYEERLRHLTEIYYLKPEE